MCHNQSNLAAGHHANANLEGICPVELADLCCKTAANDLGDKCHNDKADTEQQDIGSQAADIGFEADGSKEHRSKHHIVADFDTALHIGCIMNVAQHDTSNVSTGNIGNAKVLLCNVSHGKAEAKAGNGNALGVGVTVIQPGHGLVQHKTDNDRHHKEQHRVDQHLADAGTAFFAAAGPQNAGKHHNADNVINHGCADDGGAQEAFQLAKLLQGCHRDGNAGCRHNGADEQCFIKFRTADSTQTIERTIQQRTAHQGNKNTHAGNQSCNGAGFHQLLQVGAKAGGEHQQNNADFRKDRDGIAELNNPQQRGANQQTGDDLAHHLGCLEFAGNQAKKLSCNQYDCKIPEE